MKYYLYLKSYTEAPDYEDEVKADSREQAVMIFYNRLKKYGWAEETIDINVSAENELN